MKDHEKAALVNKLRDIAIEFHATGQLRARIRDVLLPALAASGGNAAPGLTLDKINELAAKHIQDICGISRPPAPMGEDHEFVILCRAIEAASAPNAALVAALRKIKKNETEVFDEAMGEMVIVGLDAEEMVEIASAALAQAGEVAK